LGQDADENLKTRIKEEEMRMARKSVVKRVERRVGKGVKAVGNTTTRVMKRLLG